MTASKPLATPKALSDFLRMRAKELGFDLVGIAPVTIGLGADRLCQWLEEKKHGEMTYMATHRAAREDPSKILKDARSVVMVAMGYRTKDRLPEAPGEASISRYAWGRDYHDVLRTQLKALAKELQTQWPDIRSRAVVDSAPLMERDYARLAGLGWFGKNTLLLNRGLGSWFFLGGLLVDAELEYDQPFESDHCGSCTRCLDACPTDAFTGPYELDPRRCISYLTIEHKSPISEELRPDMESWVFGCDVCQDVCPWNSKSPLGASEFTPLPGSEPLSLLSLLSLTEAEFRDRFRGTPLWRTGRSRLLRNAAIVAGNQRAIAAQEILQVLTRDPDPLVGEAASWALAKIGDGKT